MHIVSFHLIDWELRCVHVHEVPISFSRLSLGSMLVERLAKALDIKRVDDLNGLAVIPPFKICRADVSEAGDEFVRLWNDAYLVSISW